MARFGITLDTPKRVAVARAYFDRAVQLGWRKGDSHNESEVLDWNGPAGATNATSGPNPNGSDKDHVMAKRQIPSPEVLRQLLSYDPETGKLFWKERGPEWFKPGNTSIEANCSSWNKRMAGKEAFTSISPNGYNVGAVGNVTLLAHRVIWAIQTGSWPIAFVDHANGTKTDNKWANLRAATKSENSQNTLVRADNRLGVAGVRKRGNVYRAEICLAGRRVNLGHFPSAEEASAAYTQAKASLHTHHRVQS